MRLFVEFYNSYISLCVYRPRQLDSFPHRSRYIFSLISTTIVQMILATQINWSMGVDEALNRDDTEVALKERLASLEGKLAVMAETVLLELPADSRKKFEQMITELVHQRDVVRDLIKDNVSSPTDFRWLYHLRYTYNPEAPEITEKLMISLSNATFSYW
jgi:dynein heavy chain 1